MISTGSRPFSVHDVVRTREEAMLALKTSIEKQPRANFRARYSTYQKLTDSDGNNLGTGEATYQLSGRRIFLKGSANSKASREAELIAITEAYVLSAVLVRHPNIVRLYDVLRDSRDNFVLEFEHHERGSVFHAAVSDPAGFDAGVIKHFIGCASAALAYCHAHHVAHCDIKPINFVITENGDFSLVDFGMARFIEHGVLRHHAAVNPDGHRPPEILLGLSWNFAVDVWSLGCSVIELYCMHRQQEVPLCIDGQSTKEMELIHLTSMFGAIPEDMLQSAAPALRIMLGDAAAISDVSGLRQFDGEVYDMVMKMMRMHPKDRITSAAAAVTVLAHARRYEKEKVS